MSSFALITAKFYELYRTGCINKKLTPFDYGFFYKVWVDMLDTERMKCMSALQKSNEMGRITVVLVKLTMHFHNRLGEFFDKYKKDLEMSHN